MVSAARSCFGARGRPNLPPKQHTFEELGCLTGWWQVQLNVETQRERAFKSQEARSVRRAETEALLTPRSYVGRTEAPGDRAGFKAAGVVPLAVVGGQLCALLGIEPRKGSSARPVLHFLAGKRESYDHGPVQLPAL